MAAAKKRKPKAKIPTKPAAAKKAPASRRNAGVNEESKVLFLDTHLPEIAKMRDRAKTANGNLRNAYRAAKKDGFSKADFDAAFRLKTQTGEREIKSAIAREMTIARWLGFALGKQLDLFLDADDHDIEGQAYAEGEEASRNNRQASPIYAPGTPGFEAYMRGFNDHQEELSKRIGKLEPETSSGTPMTRSQFRAQQMKKAADAAEERSMFQKRQPDVA